MSINKQNKAFRRGAVLGLTLAEIMLLVLFLLLLIFSIKLKTERDLRVESEQQLTLMSKNKNDIKQIAMVLNQEEPDMRDELVEAVEGMPYISQLIKKENLKKDKAETTKQVLVRGIQKLIDSKKIDDMTQPTSMESQLLQAVTEKEELKSELQNQKNQNLNLIHELHKEGTGYGLPPCWPDSNGKPTEYIFNVDLYSDGIVIHDNKLPNRIDDQAKLPISMIMFDEKLDISEFREQTLPIFNWSEKNSCRFYVGIHDRTASDEKVLYKKLKSVVENERFYKYEYTN